MAVRLSRRQLADYIADAIIKDSEVELRINQVAAYLIESRRSRELNQVVGEIEARLNDYGVVLARVESPVTLSGDSKEAIVDSIKKTLSAKHVEITETVEPKLLGGVKIDFAGMCIDDTVSRRLKLFMLSNKE